MSSTILDDFHTYTFGVFSPDTARGALLKNGVEIKLRPQSFEILRVLILRCGILVTREELQAAVWGDKVVTDGSLVQCLLDIRKAIGDSDRKIIRTVSRRGYIFNAEVIERANPTIEETAPRGSTRRGTAFTVATAVLLVTALTALWFFGGADTEMISPDRSTSIAVLPFLDMSENKTQEFFADGIAEELLNLLAKIPELRVISRTSAASFKGKDIDIPEIAEQLNVTHVLEGSVRKSGNRIRITTQLIEARSDTHLWSETYEFELKDIFAIEDEVSAQVVSELKIALLGDAPKAIVTDPEAYELFLQARFLADHFTIDSVQKAIVLYERVLDIDPEYLPAWVWKADSHYILSFHDVPDPRAHLRLSMESINRALEIDPDNASVLAMASAASTADGDIERAVSQIRRALEIAPNDLDVIENTIFVFEKLGRYSDLANVMEYVLARDPLNGKVRSIITYAYMMSGNYERTVELSEQTLATSPDDFMALIAIPWAEYLAGNPEAMLRLSERVPGSWSQTQIATVAHHALGNQDAYASGIRKMLQMLEDAEPLSNHYQLATVYAYVGDEDATFSELENAIELGEHQVMFDDLPFTALIGDPRYDALMERAGMPREKMEAIQFEVNLPPQ